MKFFKYLLIVIFISCFALNCFSQEPKEVEVGIGIESCLSRYFDQYTYGYPYLSAKYVIEKNAIRGGMGIHPYKFSVGNHFDYNINLGYERRLVNRKIKIYGRF